jgi:hypothetical protein
MPTTTGEMPARIWETTRVHSPISAKRERINPNDAWLYYNRGIVRSDLGDKQGAVADYNEARAN